MKKSFKFALLSAIALTGAVSLTSCSSNEDVADVNPTYDGESVKTQFTISFPQNVAATRMAADQVQAAASIATFRGMDNIKLIPFGVNTTITNADTRLGAPINLVQQIAGSAVETKTVNNYIAATDLGAKSNAVLYQDVQIPVGTGAFLFYGKAIDNNATEVISTIADKFKFGTLTPSAELSSSSTDVPTDINFTPVAIKIVPPEGSGTAADIATYLTSIANTTGWSTETENAAIKQLYDRFITMRAGSSQAAADLIGDLLWSIRNNTSTIAEAIRTSIYHGQTYSSTDGTMDETNDNFIKKVEIGTGTFEVTLGDKCAGYPANNNLPVGAAQIRWDDTEKKFNVVSTDVPTATSTSMNVAALDRYVYPANLQYYVNSRAMVSESSQKEKYNSTNNWNQILSNYTAGYVSSPTRSVAIELPIQYGVGQLKMQARTAADVLIDNSDQPGTSEEKTVPVPAEGFPIKGILIGGQRAVDWEFLPMTRSGSNLYTIYDKIESTNPISVAKTNFANAFNYTLALETPIQENVYIALEIENTSGQAFYGQDNQIILPGRTFYLVGELNPTINSTQKYARAHNTYWSNGDVAQKTTSDNIDQVFVQDYVTTLNITIQNLRKALNTIPDLRMPNMEFGMSVDLSWESGIKFNIDIE